MLAFLLYYSILKGHGFPPNTGLNIGIGVLSEGVGIGSVVNYEKRNLHIKQILTVLLHGRVVLWQTTSVQISYQYSVFTIMVDMQLISLKTG